MTDNHSVGVAFADASGIVESTLVAKNAIGATVLLGSKLVEEMNVDAELPVVFTRDTRLVENGTRIGVTEIPVPGGDWETEPPTSER